MSRRLFPVDDNGSSSTPESLLLQYQKPLDSDQALAEAFGRLSFSATPFDQQPPFDFISDCSYVIDGASNGFSHYYSIDGSHPHQSFNLGQNNINGAAANTGKTLIQNSSSVGCDRDSWRLNGSWSGSYPMIGGISYCDGFLDYQTLLRQREFGSGFSNVNLSNGGRRGGGEFRQNSHGGSSNEFLGDRSNIPWFNANTRLLLGSQGSLLSLAIDQNGSRMLQEKMKNLTPEEVSFIWRQLICHATELMLDQCGNHVFQKLVEICSEEQRTQIIYMVTVPYLHLVNICLSQHGARAVEKLLDHVTTEEQRALIMSSLNPGAVELAKDTNGHRVVVHCVKHFPAEDIEYLLKKVLINCFGMAIDKTGCCVLQQCVRYAQGEIKKQLIADIILNASILAEDCYGNYVVQHLLSLKVPEVTEALLSHLEGKFFHLALNKYGSNVVEKFFHDADEQQSARINLELFLNPNVTRLLVDPYGNYVIQSALLVSKGAIRGALLELIQVNSRNMRSNHYGKKLLDRLDKERARRI